jgi:hypothetical protein
MLSARWMRREVDNEYGMGRDIERGDRGILHSAWRVPTFDGLDKESHRKRVTSLSLRGRHSIWPSLCLRPLTLTARLLCHGSQILALNSLSGQALLHIVYIPRALVCVCVCVCACACVYIYIIYIYKYMWAGPYCYWSAGVAQSVQCLTTDWTTGRSIPSRGRGFFL